MGMGHSNNRSMKKILLVGGTGGIGTELAKLVDKEEYKGVVTSSKDYDVTGVYPFPADLGDADIVVSLAGLTQNNLLSEFYPRTRHTIDVNCLGAVTVLGDFLPLMIKREYGRIIFISSIYSTMGIKGQGVYSASKAFVDRLVKTAAIENAAYGITVNSIQLGFTGIGMGKMDEPDRGLNKVGLLRYCTIEELWQTIKFIIDTEYITGQNIRLDGGVK
jgi:3-oxoacyl-[acyl-carrier protein] reductase